MARPPRIDFPGAFHHITSRGNRRSDIFLCDGDRRLFIAILADVCRVHGWLCHAYCLMSNHYHLLIETGRATLSTGMKHLNGEFTQAFNYRHEAVGHIFQGRFKSVLVQRDSHLMEVCRYVVLNPVRAGMVPGPADWAWSSYRAMAGMDKAPSFLDVAMTRSLFSNETDRACERYQEFVAAGLTAVSPFADAKNGVLGDDAFMQNVRRTVGVEPRPSLACLLSAKDDRRRRNDNIIAARLQHGYGITEIANFLQLHHSSVSKIIHGKNSQFTS